MHFLTKDRLSKSQVRQIIEHGIQKGYESTSDFSDAEIDEILKLIELRDFANYLSSEWNCPDIDDDIIEDYIKI